MSQDQYATQDPTSQHLDSLPANQLERVFLASQESSDVNGEVIGVTGGAPLS